ncbi:MAG: PAS domain-containing protein, partial [Victivallaceae bacterium]
MILKKKKESFLDRFIERVDSIDANSLQAYILHLSREKGFFETIFNAVEEGILVVDRSLHIRYHNRAAAELLGLPDDIERVRLSQFLQNVDWFSILKQDADEWTRMSRQEIEIRYPEHRY